MRDTIVDWVAHRIRLGGARSAVPLDRRANENVFEVLQLVLELSIFKHYIFKVAFSQVLHHADLVVLLAQAVKLELVLVEELGIGGL